MPKIDINKLTFDKKVTMGCSNEIKTVNTYEIDLNSQKLHDKIVMFLLKACSRKFI